MKEWLSIKEMAEKTKIPDPSIRRYIEKFSSFFTHKGGARSKRYEDTGLKVLLRIKQLYDEGYETDGIDGILRKEFAVIIDDDSVGENVEKAVTPTLATAEDMAEIKKALEEQREFNKQQQVFNQALIEKLNAQENYIKESLVKRDQQLLESMKQSMKEQQAVAEMAATVEREQKVKSSFWSRLFGGK